MGRRDVKVRMAALFSVVARLMGPFLTLGPYPCLPRDFLNETLLWLCTRVNPGKQCRLDLHHKDLLPSGRYMARLNVYAHTTNELVISRLGKDVFRENIDFQIFLSKILILISPNFFTDKLYTWQLLLSMSI